MKLTTNYKLKKPDGTDVVNVEYFNDNADIIDAELSKKVDKTQVLTDVPANAKFTDTVYIHPSTHPASMITQDANNRFVSDSEKANWNGKVGKPGVVNATLSTSWSGTGPFTQAVSIGGVLATSNVLYDVNNATVTQAQMEAFIKGEIVIASKATNSITFKALKTKPAVAIPISIIILGA